MWSRRSGARTLEERASLLEPMARNERDRGRERAADAYDERWAEACVHSERNRGLLARKIGKSVR